MGQAVDHQLGVPDRGDEGAERQPRATALYSTTDTNRPDTEAVIGGAFEVASATELAPDGNVVAHRCHVRRLAAAALRQRDAGRADRGIRVDRDVDGALRIGGNAVWGEWFNGWIDEVRVYGRALSAAEIQDDMNTSVVPDTTAPTVVTRVPANLAAGVNVGTAVSATFSELMRASTVTSSNVVLQGPGARGVPATVSYDPATSVATLTPQAALQYGTTYTATVKGGSGGVTDYVGQPARGRRHLDVRDGGIAAAGARGELALPTSSAPT